jgi:rhomboid family GlyGly-CTERM serine protease
METVRRVPWVILTAVAACAAVSALPGGGALLEYDRARVAGGEVWRLLTGQMVHWTARMALADLAVLLGLGLWLEIGGRRRALLLALALGAAVTALGVQFFQPGLAVYRGSSGLAAALFTLTALEAMRPPAGRRTFRLAACALLLFTAKVAWETAGGTPLFAGDLPDGVAATPLIHLLGGLAGLAAFEIGLRKDQKDLKDPKDKTSSRP